MKIRKAIKKDLSIIMEIEKGTFGNIDEYKVLFILNEEADKDKRIRKILTKQRRRN